MNNPTRCSTSDMTQPKSRSDKPRGAAERGATFANPSRGRQRKRSPRRREKLRPNFGARAMDSNSFLVLCSLLNYGLIGLKPARCQESAARTGFVNPLSRRDAADGRFQANPTGGCQGAVGFVARRQRMYSYVILLASRPQPLGPPSTRNYGWNRALGTTCVRQWHNLKTVSAWVCNPAATIATRAVAGHIPDAALSDTSMPPRNNPP